MSKKPIEPDLLRTNAEAQLARAPEKGGAQRPAEELLHELQVHQVELEMQNEELRQAQVELEESRDLYVDFYDFSPVGYITLNHEAMIDEINLTGAKLLGMERSKLMQRRFVLFVAPEDRYRWHLHFLAVLKDDDKKDCELLIQRIDGSSFFAKLYCLRLKDNANKSAMRMVIVDITEGKRASELVIANKELVTAREAAEAANRAKSTFLASISHELRTPLNAILGFSNLMRRDSQLRSDQRDNLDIINRSGEHLLALINDVLEVTKIEAGKIQLINAPIDLGLLVRDVTDLMEPRANEKGLSLRLDQSSSFPRYINADEAHLRQILINLLGNAVKFTQQGGVTLRLGTKQDVTAHLIIEIEDSGIGISAEDQQQLFQPFVQLGKRPGDNQGSGLGLSITRKFVQLMGGSITVESTPGKGSLFRVELPLIEANETDLVLPQEAGKGEIVGVAPGQARYRILIVEDDPVNQLLLSRLMQHIGFEIKVAADGVQGIQLFQSWQPHLIWMDRRMPVMDGLEATQAIRQLPGGKDVKIIAVTAAALEEERDEMMEAGMDDFVRKPYRFNEIYDCLGKQLSVQYSYAEPQTDNKSPAVILTTEMLAVLPPALRNELRAGLESLREEQINAALQQVAEYDVTLYHELSRLVDNFDYPSILKVLPRA
jgi:PAS domain S-box-containing protein